MRRDGALSFLPAEIEGEKEKKRPTRVHRLGGQTLRAVVGAAVECANCRLWLLGRWCGIRHPTLHCSFTNL